LQVQFNREEVGEANRPASSKPMAGLRGPILRCGIRRLDTGGRTVNDWMVTGDIHNAKAIADSYSSSS
jgi:hypothetical protein